MKSKWPAGLLTSTGRGLVVAALDQIAYSASTMLLVVLVARSASFEQFGQFGISQSALLVCLSLSRGGFGQIVAASAAVAAQRGQGSSLLRSALGRASALTAVPAVLVAVFQLTSGAGAWFALVVLAAPLAVVQDVLRMWLFGTNQGRKALLADGSWLGLQIGALAIGGVAHDNGAITAVGGWLAGLFAASCVCGHGLALRGGGCNEAVAERPLLHGSAHGLTSAMFLEIHRSLPLLAASYFVGVGGVGALRGAQTLLAPARLAAQSFGLTLLPRAARSWRAGRTPLPQAVALAASSAGVLGLSAVATLLLPGRVGIELLGQSWEASRQVVVALAVFNASLAVINGAQLFLVACEQMSRLTLLRVAALVGAVAGTGVGLLGEFGLRWAMVLGGGSGLAAAAIGSLAHGLLRGDACIRSVIYADQSANSDAEVEGREAVLLPLNARK